MKYNYCLGIFLLIILITATINVDLQKPKSKASKRKGKGKKGSNVKSAKKPKNFSRKSKEQKNSLASPVDLDVLIRFKFSKYGTNVLANYVAGVLSAFYNKQFQFLQKQDHSQFVVEKHIQCLNKQLSSIMGNDEAVKMFENKFLFGGLYPFKKQERHYKKYAGQYKLLLKKNRIIRIVRRLKLLTGTFQKNSTYKKKVKKLNKLYRKYKKTGIPRRLLVKFRLNKRKIVKRQKKKTKKSFKKAFKKSKLKAINKKIRKWKKEISLDLKAKRIIGKNAFHVIQHAKFMTYAFRKIWFYSSFFTRKVISCGISASSKYRTIQKHFLSIYRRNQRIACPYKYIDVLSIMLEKYTVRNAFKTLFTSLLVKGIKNRLIHRIKWYKIGQAVFSAHQVLEKLCPWF